MPVRARTVSALRPLIVSVLIIVGLLSANSAGAARWSRQFQPMGLDGPPGYDGQTFVLGEWSGELVVGGWFQQAGGLTAANFALWDGDTWRVLDGGPNGTVRAVHDGGPDLYLGGEFSQVDGDNQRGVAFWDGTLGEWRHLGDPGGFVYDFEQFGGHLLAGGSFYTGSIYGMYAPLAWHDLEGWRYELQNVGWEGSFKALDLQTWLQSLYVGGTFWLEFQDANNLLRWDGEELYPFELDSTVKCLEPTDTGLYAGGSFENCNGLVSHGLVGVGEGGCSPVDDPGTPRNVNGLDEDISRPLAVALDHEVRIYQGSWESPLGGAFADQLYAVRWYGGDLYAGGLIPNGIARWDGAAEQWVNLGGGLQPSHYINSLTVWDGDLYAGGMFIIPQTTAGVTFSHVARWDGRAWLRLGAGVNNSVYALHPFQGSLFVGGDFDRAGGSPSLNIARWDGEAWHDIGGANSRVTSFCLHDGDLVAGGWFTSIGGVSASRVAAFDGADWRAIGGDINGIVEAVTVYQGDLVIGGGFDQIGGTPFGRVARWDGAAWQQLGGGLDSKVSALAVWEGDLFAAGIFLNAAGMPASGIARWDGATWQPLGDGLGGMVSGRGALALLSTRDQLLVGGAFTHAGGAPAACVAAWGGAGWSEFQGGVGVGSGTTRVEAMAVLDGDLYLGGQFGSAGGIPSSNIARWIDGTIVGNLLASLGAEAVVAQPGGPGAWDRPRAVSVSWILAEPVAVDRLRLTADAGGEDWDVPFETDGLNYSARDESPALATVSQARYTLLHAAEPGTWSVLGEKTVTFASPATPGAPAPSLSIRPNPFNPRTEVSFELVQPGTVRVAVHSLTGGLVTVLVDGPQTAGPHTVAWDGRDAGGREVPAGAYVVRITTATGTNSAKVMVVR
ncbi:MAG: FlgD immunoglobulin-like domain containing protein [Candidatus Latescibacteria bacterium]|nr:FlgD immunoglobulin-like domain containing protein [Candidatus Latescibacterota bacterium]